MYINDETIVLESNDASQLVLPNESVFIAEYNIFERGQGIWLDRNAVLAGQRPSWWHMLSVISWSGIMRKNDHHYKSQHEYVES